MGDGGSHVGEVVLGGRLVFVQVLPDALSLPLESQLQPRGGGAPAFTGLI